MARHKLFVLSNPSPGGEAAYNAWYNDEHLPEIVTLPGFGAARRMKLVVNGLGPAAGFQHNYLAIYDIETEDVQAAVAALLESAERMFIAESLDMASVVCGVFESCSDEVRPPAPPSAAAGGR
jgi:hypothetical protein